MEEICPDCCVQHNWMGNSLSFHSYSSISRGDRTPTRRHPVNLHPLSFFALNLSFLWVASSALKTTTHGSLSSSLYLWESVCSLDRSSSSSHWRNSRSSPSNSTNGRKWWCPIWECCCSSFPSSLWWLSSASIASTMQPTPPPSIPDINNTTHALGHPPFQAPFANWTATSQITVWWCWKDSQSLCLEFCSSSSSHPLNSSFIGSMSSRRSTDWCGKEIKQPSWICGKSLGVRQPPAVLQSHWPEYPPWQWWRIIFLPRSQQMTTTMKKRVSRNLLHPPLRND